MILGISSYFHDSSVCLLSDNGIILAAAQEERFSRVKNDSRFPAKAMQWIFKHHRLKIDDVEAIVFYEDGLAKANRVLKFNYEDNLPSIFKYDYYTRLLSDFETKLQVSKDAIQTKLKFSDHHYSHASSAFYPSPFNNAAVLTIDGVGESETNVLFHGVKNNLKCLKSINFPDSLGLFYSFFTYFST